MTARRGGENEALQAVAREVQREPLPELDWARVERRISERAESAGTELAGPTSRRYRWPALGGLAAAVAVAVGIHTTQGSEPGPQARSAPALTSPAPEPAAPAILDGDELPVGRVLEAPTAAVRIDHGERASWSLERGSRARILQHDGVIRIALDAGSLLAKVTPSAREESFAVEVDRARVAVRGTAFRVERRAGGLLVEVSEGTVAVGPAAGRQTRNWLLVAPAHGSFALDGTKDGTSLPRPSPARSAHATPGLEGAAPGFVPDAPPMSAIEAGVSRILEVANRCFAMHTTRRGDMHVVVRSTMTLEVLPDGSVEHVAFAPPLAPAVESCAKSGTGSVRFAQSVEGARVTRTLELTP